MSMKNKLIIATVASAMLGVGCSKGSKSSGSGAPATDSSLTISGALGSSAAMNLNSKMTSGKKGNIPQSKIGAMAVTVTDLKLYGVAISSSGISADAVDLAADGSFSLTLPDAKGAMVTLLFIDKTSCSDQANPATCDSAGSVEFQDTSKKNMNGEPKTTQSIPLTGSVNLGNIEIGSDGKVTIPVSQIATVTSTTNVAASTAFDFSGVWTAAKFDAALPKGYTGIMTAEEQMAQQDGGGGPMVGMPITLIRLAGKSFTKAAGCTSNSVCAETDGTVGTEDSYGISIWAGGIAPATVGPMTLPSGIHACGDKLGFSASDARYSAGIHLASAPTISGQGTSLALSFGDYVWATKSGYGQDPTGTTVLPWMKTNAQPRQQDVQKCNGKTINGKQAWACESYVDANNNHTLDGGEITVYTAGLGGGCFDANNKPVMVSNWGPSGVQGTCESVADATLPAGFHSNVCTYTNQDPDGTEGVKGGGSTAIVNKPAMNFTCKNSFGMFVDANLTSEYTVSGQWHPIQPKSQHVSYCRQITDTLQKYRCYAEASNDGGGGGPDAWGTCAREFRFNWGATTAGEFVQSTGRDKPDAAFITDVVSYSADGLTMNVEHADKEVRTVGGDGKEVFCTVVKNTKIKVTKLTDTKLLFDLTEDARMENQDNQACIAAAKSEFRNDIRGNKTLFSL